MHGSSTYDSRLEELKRGVEQFRNTSRISARAAQSREIQTAHDQESTLGEKATITLTNFLGGVYYLTIDEFEIRANRAYLIEKKHSRTSPIPSADDIKDGAVKMALFTNLARLSDETGKTYRALPLIGLTSPKVIGYCTHRSSDSDFEQFIDTNDLKPNKERILRSIRIEANTNDFGFYLSNERDESMIRGSLFG